MAQPHSCVKQQGEVKKKRLMCFSHRLDGWQKLNNRVYRAPQDLTLVS